MRRLMYSTFLLFSACTLLAQKREEKFDYSFKPTTDAPRYFVVTEKKDSVWFRQAWYLPERGMHLQGSYKDSDCKIPHGEVLRYYPNKTLKSKSYFVNGKIEGTCLKYDEEGRLQDSGNYVAGSQKGVRLQWYPNGMTKDSMQFDGAGNGVEISWSDEGNLSAAGLWVSDTAKKGLWKYYHPNEKLMATEEFADGKMISCNCFDETGQVLESTACLERKADFPGGPKAWRKFISRTMKTHIAYSNPGGVEYGVVCEFTVDIDGSIIQVRALTSFGLGMEKEIERILNLSPRWIPARRHGRLVKEYHAEIFTFRK